MNENSYNRLARTLMDQGMSYEAALKKLNSLQLRISCGAEIRDSAAQQAALLTAVNSGKRAFLGGVAVNMPDDVKLRVPWPGVSLNSVVSTLGGVFDPPRVQSDDTPQLLLGSAEPHANFGLRLYCDGWRGAIGPPDADVAAFTPGSDFALGGVISGALGVAHSFLKATGVHVRAGDSVVGISAWRPDLHWLDPHATGPILEGLPKSFWLLGLGHLGQAYLWNVGLLPFAKPAEVKVVLQDFDHLVEANWSAGLLTEKMKPTYYKTRLCASWLEARDFRTAITERRYNEHTVRAGDEPYLALCGFDNAAARTHLEDSGFDLVLEAALGGSLSTFDRIMMHTFPDASKTARTIWGGHAQESAQPTAEIVELTKDIEDCGILAISLANKAISASFVGALAGALVLGEALRACCGGVRCEILSGMVRNFEARDVALHQRESYSKELARNGIVNATRSR